MNEYQQLWPSYRYSSDQLLGVFVEALLGNFWKAQEIFESLKQTYFWDEKRKQWIDYMNKDQELICKVRPANAQLLGVLAEHVLGKFTEAKKKI